MDIKDQISYLKDMVKLYEDRECKDNEDIKTCGRNVLPSNTAFYRPDGVFGLCPPPIIPITVSLVTVSPLLTSAWARCIYIVV